MSPLASATGCAALVFAFESAGLPRATEPSCSVTGVEVLGADLTGADVCRSFSRQLLTSLRDQSVFVDPETMEMVIAISKRGSITARAELHTDKEAIAFPEVTLDVTDRSLAVRDLDHLASSVAIVIARELEARA